MKIAAQIQNTQAHTPLAIVGRVIGKNVWGVREKGREQETDRDRERKREKRDVNTRQKYREENGRRSTAAGYGGCTRGEGNRSRSAIKRGEIQGAHEGVGKARHPS